MSYDNKDSGALFKNDQKSADNSPDYKGRINVGGKDYWLAAWIKTAKDGRKYMSLAPTEMKPLEAQPKAEKQNIRDMRDDIPF